MSILPEFDYDQAFSRNLGWVTEAEQLALRGKTVAIAGLGGVGGVHLITLARLGIGGFRIADFDKFDFPNFNRQIGAFVDTVGHPKIDVVEKMARGINPEIHVARFPNGVTPENLDEFLDGADLFVDGLDFFVLDIRRRIFARCAERGIPAVTAAPIGFGTCFMAFTPGGMSFEDYFRLAGKSEEEQYLHFLLGLTPRSLHRGYLVDPSRVDLAGKKGPSSVAACQLCAGVTAVMAVKLLLRRGDVQAAPYHHHFDAYRLKFVTTKLRFGNAGPFQRLKLSVARKIYGRMARSSVGMAPKPLNARIIEQILDAARWAPSGDNKQPWRFEILDDENVLVHVSEPDPDNIYEYRGGEPLLLAAGTLMASLRAAASGHGRSLRWELAGNTHPYRIAVRMTPDASVPRDPLWPYLGLRSVDRRRYKTRALTPAEISDLNQSVAGTLAIDWFATGSQRWKFARLSAMATWIRLRMKEAYPVHREAIDWNRKLSPSGIPSGALGLDPATVGLMRWAMRSWPRLALLNRLGGATTSAIQMDYIPIVSSAACFVMRLAPAKMSGEAITARETIEAGEAIQRFWLTAAKRDLAVQPALATLIFAHYGSSLVASEPAIVARATRLARDFSDLTGHLPSEVVFMGRVGEPISSMSHLRSTRRALIGTAAP